MPIETWLLSSCSDDKLQWNSVPDQLFSVPAPRVHRIGIYNIEKSSNAVTWLLWHCYTLNFEFIFSAFCFRGCILMSWKKEYTLEYSEYGEYYIPHFRVNSRIKITKETILQICYIRRGSHYGRFCWGLFTLGIKICQHTHFLMWPNVCFFQKNSKSEKNIKDADMLGLG